MLSTSNEKEIWDQTAEMHGNYSVALSKKSTSLFLHSPKEVFKALSLYKFSEKMGMKNSDVLEIGCGFGFGAPLLAERARSYLGIDTDLDEINAAKANLSLAKFTFLQSEFLGKQFGHFDLIVSINYTPPSQELFASFLSTALFNLKENGIFVFGIKNTLPFDFTHSLLKAKFSQMLLFSMNNDVISPGIIPQSEYCLFVLFYKKDA